mmetsp:Transcript_5518/g.8003  ORF Transcript_5518/g.8003 Transcript_5518/m.8003 type:complete len:219 (+) Transcript_5518:94-750(+)|eukprot:CAMPEP_0202444130 /NCGR_PEP_ID=MMETSP1360-20130828/3273_1 /ASSEMBLY_ACC=CAM_ASM_000848 /TAXON_ID=515479 /ORGANISM="Licmophora paradoxa, Strain CCMP2313" /LENGTH=218 /DNA_ID=CAMNT_0049060037 /DNA_START=72 /DNA_END=728 /DNA_ORIENTATION=-
MSNNNNTTNNKKKPGSDGKVYYSYSDIHNTLSNLAPTLLQDFRPDVMIAIGGGGYIPARILRTYLKVPILAVSLELYDDTTNSVSSDGVICHQWYDASSVPGSRVEGGRVLIIDEVDDTRTTLQYCVEELLKRGRPGRIGVCVVHNKRKEKLGVLPENVDYFAGEEVEDYWNCYPWDAGAYTSSSTDSNDRPNTIYQHEELARKCSGFSSGKEELAEP